LKKVLIITYYWPPSGGAGVQRWLKFTKYLREFGWEPVIYTPSNGEIPVVDNSLIKDIPNGITVLTQPIWEPYSLYKKFIGQKKGEKINTGFLTERKKPRLTEKIAVWLRGNLFIPDARKFWIRPSIKFLSSYLQNHPVDAIISTGPPHSMHLIAKGLKKQVAIPWLADFRDPWTNIDFYADLMLTPAANAKHHRLELEVLKEASAVVSIGKTMSLELSALLQKYTGVKSDGDKFSVITNGYDTDDIYEGAISMDNKFSIAHIGTLVKSRNPEVLWQVLKALVNEDPLFAQDLEIKLVGKVDVFVKDAIEKYGLHKYVHQIDYLSHEEVIHQQQASQVLLLLVNNTKNAKGILTGKFFEYLSARRPVLCIGPEDAEVADIIKETNAGIVVDYAAFEVLKGAVLNFYKSYKSNTLEVESLGIEKYSRRALTGELVGLLNNFC
jgi:glycosyltransferase involved in cell wall biosynthesis